MKHPRAITADLRIAATAAALTTAAAVLPATAFAAPPPPDMSTKLAGRTVFVDPGHQGPDHTQDLAHAVNDGRGGTKACQTTGMTSRNGIPEHTINWNVAQLVQQSLTALGAHVVLSRQDDTGWGGCVDERAAAANRSGADVAISIHADGAPAADHGVHFIVPQLPVPDAKANQVQSGAGLAATKAVRDAYVKAGFATANYAGAVDGLQTRSDIAGPALTEVPDVFVEMGNGANPDDAALLETPDGQIKHAVAITTGLVSYLLGLPIASSGSAGAAAPPGPAAVPASNTAPGRATVPGNSPALAPPDTAPEPGTSATDSVAPGGSTPQASAPGTPAAPGLAAPSGPSTGPTSSGGTTSGGTSSGATGPGTSGAASPTGPGAGTGGATAGFGTGTRPGAGAGNGAATTSPNTGRGARSQAPGVTPQTGTTHLAPGATAPEYGTGTRSRIAPGFGTGTQASPGAAPQTSPGGAGQDLAPQTPPSQGAGAQAAPGQSGAGASGVVDGLVGTALRLLAPLAKSLGIGDDNAMTAELVNLAYTLVSTLLGPSK